MSTHSSIKASARHVGNTGGQRVVLTGLAHGTRNGVSRPQFSVWVDVRGCPGAPLTYVAAADITSQPAILVRLIEAPYVPDITSVSATSVRTTSSGAAHGDLTHDQTYAGQRSLSPRS